MPRAIFAIIVLLVAAQLNAQTAATRPDYRELIRRSILRDYPGMLHEPTGALKNRFITPGSVYAKELWDWDSWLSDVALCQIMMDERRSANGGQAVDREKMLSYGRGCVLNFLAAAKEDGEIPIRIQVKPKGSTRAAETRPSATTRSVCTNMHKPVVAQHAAMLVILDNGDAQWLRAKFGVLQAFMRNYRDHQFNAPTGLYFWLDDLAIGVDNDPATFFRPSKSSGSIFLNCLMYRELLAMAYLARELKLPDDVAKGYDEQAEALKRAVQEHCWDERDGYFYSVDLNLRAISDEPGDYLDSRFVLHKGHPRDFDCLIQRIEGWSGFMAMWSDIATPEQAKRMVEERLKNQKTLGARFGIRTLSKMEKMYGLYPSNNPSNWDGPVWGISNYMVFRGLVKYGFTAEAREMADKTIELFGRDYEANGALHEYYNPDTGEPIVNKGFQNWNYLVMNMMAWEEGRAVVGEY
jgi:putative isomerase